MNYSTVYLRGAYGPGNLGDDVLLVAMISILKKKFPSCQITVGVENIALAKKLDGSVNWVSSKSPFIAKYFIYGGGGQFFSFDRGVMDASQVLELNLFNKILSFVRNQNSFFSLITRLFFSILRANENLVLSKYTAAYCIGIGPFEIKGKGIKRLNSLLRSAQFISVRDEKSLKYCLGRISREDVMVFSDPSFKLSDWFDKESYDVSQNNCKYDYSYIVREWPHSKFGHDQITTMIEHAKFQTELGKKIRLVSLDASKDSKIISKYNTFDWLIYDVENDGISSFLHDLVVNSRLVISARAHGVWLSVMLNKPVLSVGIEPKLENVHRSLPNSTQLVMETDLDKFHDKFKIFEESQELLASSIKSDLKLNKSRADSARIKFYDWMNTHA